MIVLFLAIVALIGLTPVPAYPGWHGNSARFHEHDVGLWRIGHWVHGDYGGRFGWWGGLWNGRSGTGSYTPIIRFRSVYAADGHPDTCAPGSLPPRPRHPASITVPSLRAITPMSRSVPAAGKPCQPRHRHLRRAALLHDVLVVWGAFAIFGYVWHWQSDNLFVTAMIMLASRCMTPSSSSTGCARIFATRRPVQTSQR